MEVVSQEKRIVLVKHGILSMSIAEIEGLVGEDMKRVVRPLYGMMFASVLSSDTLKMVEIQPTEVMRQYYYVEPIEGGRIYAQQHKEGISIFMAMSVPERITQNALITKLLSEYLTDKWVSIASLAETFSKISGRPVTDVEVKKVLKMGLHTKNPYIVKTERNEAKPLKWRRLTEDVNERHQQKLDDDNEYLSYFWELTSN